MKKIVLALGGNALGNNPEEQKEAVKTTAVAIVDLISEGHKLIISHGNGPQVGMINLAMSTAAESEAKTPEMPFPECGAMSQGYIGYHLQNAIGNELKSRNMDIPVVSLITQVLVDENDPAFDDPTKPIGTFYTEEEANKISEETGYIFKEDANRGYRRVVASPRPIDIIEKESVKTLVDQGHVVIAGGGGGVSVRKNGDRLEGVPAVIDKDFTSAKLAELIDADTLIILTAVEQVAVSFGKPDEKWLDKMTLDEAQQYIEDGEFAPDKKKKKIEAAMSFVESQESRTSLITSLEKASQGLKGETGTLITGN